jgi:hypothetical protein
MGRFSGGKASRRDSWSEINVRALAAAIGAIINSPCHQDRDSFGTISPIDIMGSETRGQTLLFCYLPHAQRVKKEPQSCITTATASRITIQPMRSRDSKPPASRPDAKAGVCISTIRTVSNVRSRVRDARRRKDHRGVDLISDALPFGRLWYDGPNAVTNATGYAMHDSRSHHAVIRVYDEAGNVIGTHEHTGDLKEW